MIVQETHDTVMYEKVLANGTSHFINITSFVTFYLMVLLRPYKICSTFLWLMELIVTQTFCLIRLQWKQLICKEIKIVWLYVFIFKFISLLLFEFCHPTCFYRKIFNTFCAILFLSHLIVIVHKQYDKCAIYVFLKTAN